MVWSKRTVWAMVKVMFVFDMDMNACSMVWIESKCYKSLVYWNRLRSPCDKAL